MELRDEHVQQVAADPGTTASALEGILRRAFGGRGAALGARGLGCEHRKLDARFPAEGSTLPGFVVVRRDRGCIELRGAHRFAAYTLTFLLEPHDGGTRLRARTHATFRSGLHGRAYRAVLVHGGWHARATRGLLEATRRRAERRWGEG